jgi:hypothetical protein
MNPEMIELKEAHLSIRAQPCVPGRPLEHHGVWMPTAAWERLDEAIKDVLAGQPAPKPPELVLEPEPETTDEPETQQPLFTGE